MALNNAKDHIGSDGSTFVDRINATGYAWIVVGENIAAGWPTPADVVAAWMASPGHCANIMNDAFVDLGVGYVGLPDTQYFHYWTQVFAAPR